MRQVQRGQQSRAVRGTLESFVTVGFITSFRRSMERHDGPVAHRAFQPVKWTKTDSRESRIRRLPLVTVQQCGLADRVGAGRQRTRLRFRWLPSSAVETCIDGDGQAGIQVHSPFQHHSSLTFVTYFHTRTLTRACRSDHRSEVLFGRAKGLSRPKTYGPFGPLRPAQREAFLDRPRERLVR